MKKEIDAVQLQRDIRSKLSEKYAKSREIELKELRTKFGHLKKQNAVIK